MALRPGAESTGSVAFECDLAGVRLLPVRLVGELVRSSLGSWALAYLVFPYAMLVYWPIMGSAAIGVVVTVCGFMWVYLWYASAYRKRTRTTIDHHERRLSVESPGADDTDSSWVGFGSQSADFDEIDAVSLVPVADHVFVGLRYGKLFAMKPHGFAVPAADRDCLVDALERAEIRIQDHTDGATGSAGATSRYYRGWTGRHWLQVLATPVLIGVVPAVLTATVYPEGVLHLFLPATIGVAFFLERVADRKDVLPGGDGPGAAAKGWLARLGILAVAMVVVFGLVFVLALITALAG